MIGLILMSKLSHPPLASQMMPQAQWLTAQFDSAADRSAGRLAEVGFYATRQQVIASDTGRRVGPRGATEPGRIETGAMIDAVSYRKQGNGDWVYGWVNDGRTPDYTAKQEYGFNNSFTGNWVPGMHTQDVSYQRVKSVAYSVIQQELSKVRL